MKKILTQDGKDQTIEVLGDMLAADDLGPDELVDLEYLKDRIRIHCDNLDLDADEDFVQKFAETLSAC